MSCAFKSIGLCMRVIYLQIIACIGQKDRFELQTDRLKSFNQIDFHMPIHSIWLISNLVSLETTLNMYVAFRYNVAL